MASRNSRRKQQQDANRMNQRNGQGPPNILQPNRQPQLQMEPCDGRNGHTSQLVQNPANGDLVIKHFGGRSNFETTAAQILSGIPYADMNDTVAADMAVARTKELYESMNRFQLKQAEIAKQEQEEAAKRAQDKLDAEAPPMEGAQDSDDETSDNSVDVAAPLKPTIEE